MSRLGTVGLCALVLALCLVGTSEGNEADEAKAHAMMVMTVQRQPIDVVTSNQSPRIAKIRISLDEETAFDFNEMPLADVVMFLNAKHKIAIQLDAKSLEDASIGLDTAVTRTLRGITLRSALRLLLNPIDLTYIVKDEVLLITTLKAASIERMVRIYPVGDLITPASAEKPGQDLAALTEIIKGTVEPRTWQHPGGADIQPWALGQALVIRQTWAGHEEIEPLLAGLRGSRNAESLRSRAQATVDQLERSDSEQTVPYSH